LRVSISYSHIGLAAKVGYKYGFIGSFLGGQKSAHFCGLSRTMIQKVINNYFFRKEMKKYQNPSPIPSPLDFLENKKACKSRTYRLML
jgi:hypothetical protein